MRKYFPDCRDGVKKKKKFEAENMHKIELVDLRSK